MMLGAKQGYPEAQSNLGVVYNNATGIKNLIRRPLDGDKLLWLKGSGSL